MARKKTASSSAKARSVAREKSVRCRQKARSVARKKPRQHPVAAP